MRLGITLVATTADADADADAVTSYEKYRPVLNLQILLRNWG
jgi:hypothetical protein